jgi:phosphate transport system protein
LTSLSIGALPVKPKAFKSYRDIAVIAPSQRKWPKKYTGTVFILINWIIQNNPSIKLEQNIRRRIMANILEHTSKRFDLELEAVLNGVIQMGELVREQFQLAMESLSNGDVALMKQVLDLGYHVNSLEVEIDHKCNLVLAQRQPEAVDLRTILTVLKITTDLERIGDQAELIARRAETLFQQGGTNLHRSVDIRRCAALALCMLDKALNAFTQSDVNIALQVIREDKNVNEEYSFITRNLICHMLEDPRSISSALDFLFVAKSIERIGDHAKNIAEYVIFMASGKDIRHTSIAELKVK